MDAFTLITFFSLIIFSLWFMNYIGYNDGYKHGQIDALNGKPKYYKKLMQDGEFIWVKKDKE
jgi:hypothetical protein